MTPWTAAHQAPLSMGFARQEYWSGLPLPSLFILSESENNYVVMLKKNQNWKVVTAININFIWKKNLKYCNRGKRLHFRSRLNVENKEKEEFRPLGWEDSVEEGMATHSSILAWEIPWTEEPGGLQSMGSQKSRTQRSD